MKGLSTILISFVLWGCSIVTFGQTAWSISDSLGNVIIVKDVGQLETPFDKSFVEDNFSGSFFPHQIHDSDREYEFKILEIKNQGENVFDVRALVNRRELKEGEFRSTMVHKFQFILEKKTESEFRTKNVKLLYIEI